MNWEPFVISIVIGALIGAVTNHVAIKMLFRPYRPIYLGKMRLPLTPGVIPSQREQIAQNIATTFEDKLLSGEEIHRLITGEKVQEAIERKVDELFEEFGTFGSMLGGLKPKVVSKIQSSIEEMADEAIAHGGELNIASKIEQRINEMDIERLEELVLGFSRKQFKYITLFGGVIGGLIGLVQACIHVFWLS